MAVLWCGRIPASLLVTLVARGACGGTAQANGFRMPRLYRTMSSGYTSPGATPGGAGTVGTAGPAAGGCSTMFTTACSIAGRTVAATDAYGSFGMRLLGFSCLMVSTMPPPKTVPASSQSLGSGGAGGPMTSRTVTTAPVKVPTPGIIEPLAVT